MRALALVLAAAPALADPVELFRVACLEGAGSAAVPALRPLPLDAPPDIALHPEGKAAVLLSPRPALYGTGGGPHLVLVGDAPAPEYCAVITDAATPGDARAALADVLIAARPIAGAGGFSDPEADHFLLSGGRLLTVACPDAAEGGATTALILNDFAAAAAPPPGWAGFRAAARMIPPGLPEAGSLSCTTSTA
ncbi:MAG: hypothetical protein ACU0BS_06820 [Hasllibacter sp.]